MIQIVSDWSDIENELDRLEGLPSAATRAELKGVLDFGFGLTQAAVHENTGALKSSGKVSDSNDRMDHSWSGEITYGEDSGPVDYAIYEKRRGVHWAGESSAKGDHDFMRPLDALDPLFVAAVLGGLKK